MSHPLYLNIISFLGILGLCAIAWLFSEDRRICLIPWRIMVWGIGLQLLLGFVFFQFSPTKVIINLFNQLFNSLLLAAETGARFIFGPILIPISEDLLEINLGYIFAFRALPTLVFWAGLMALLYHLGLIQRLIGWLRNIVYRTMGLSGAETFSGLVNIFLGVEAVLAIKPFLAQMTRSELCAILACCFGTAASSILTVYASFLQPLFPNILGHLVTASVLAVPACFVLSKILVPEKETFNQDPIHWIEEDKIQKETAFNVAIAGSMDGVKMAVSIVAVVLLVLGFVSLLNQLFAALSSLRTFENPAIASIGYFFTVVNLSTIEGVLFYPLTLLTGIPFNESWTASVIIGRRLLETAIPPYQTLADAASVGQLSDRTVLIVTYALSGVAHLASFAIFVGGIRALVPTRRQEIDELGWKALLIGTLATIMIACIAGVFDTGNSIVVLNARNRLG